MIEKLTDFPANVLAFVCKGHVAKREYDTVLVPAVEKALKEHKKLRLFYKVDPSFTGIEAGAVWEDMKVGFEHITHWERIAVVTDVDWIRHTIQAFAFFMPGMVKIFHLKEEAKARDWVTG